MVTLRTIRYGTLRRQTLCVLALCLFVRVTIPLGYMPGNLLAGELMTLCPVGSAAAVALLQSANPHQHHHHHKEDPASLDQSCPIGSALQVDAAPEIGPPFAVVHHRRVVATAWEFVAYVADFDGEVFVRGPPTF